MTNFETLVEDLALTSRPFFVSVGANDGVTLDPIGPIARKLNLRGIAIEPNPEAWSKLGKVYEPYPVVCCRFAIHEQDGFRRLAVPNEAYGVFKGTIDGPVEAMTHMVETVSVESLAMRYNLSQIDILVTDVEGMDHLVVKWFLDFMFRPKLICFEHTMISFFEKVRLYTRLKLYGYRLMKDGMNMIAYK